MIMFYTQEELTDLLLRAACLDRPVTPALVDHVNALMAIEVKAPQHLSYTAVPRPKVGIVNVLLSPDYAHAAFLPEASLGSVHLEHDVEQAGVELIGHLREHYANITVHH